MFCSMNETAAKRKGFSAQCFEVVFVRCGFLFLYRDQGLRSLHLTNRRNVDKRDGEPSQA